MIGLNPNLTLRHDGHHAYNKRKISYIIKESKLHNKFTLKGKKLQNLEIYID
jgi:hypothetical protein